MKKSSVSLLAAIVSLIWLQPSYAEEYFFDKISGMEVRKEMVSVDTDFQIHNPSMTYPICKIKAGTEVWIPINQLYSGSGRLIVKGTLAQPCNLKVVVSTNPLTVEQRQLPANATFYIKGGDAAGGSVIELETGEYTSASDNSPMPKIPCNPDDHSPFAEDACVNINKPGPIPTPADRRPCDELRMEIASINRNIAHAYEAFHAKNATGTFIYTEEQRRNLLSDIDFYKQRRDQLEAQLSNCSQ